LVAPSPLSFFTVTVSPGLTVANVAIHFLLCAFPLAHARELQASTNDNLSRAKGQTSATCKV